MPNSLAGISHLRTETGWLIDAGNGNDLIDATTSTEYNCLSGGNGKDTISGGMGNDCIDGGNGDDELTGNGGADVFVLSGGNDVIKDFSPSQMINREVLVNFEDLDILPGDFKFPTTYSGLNSWGLAAYAPDNSNPDNLPMIVQSGTAVGVALFSFATIFSPSGVPGDDLDFDFAAGDFARYPGEDTKKISITAYDDSEEVGVLSFSSNNQFKSHIDLEAGNVTDGTGTHSFDFYRGRFTSIDKIVIQTDNDNVVTMDNLEFKYPGVLAAGDKIDLPDGFDIAAYLATATDDGAGNTVLTNGTDSLTLVGVHSADVSADWFI